MLREFVGTLTAAPVDDARLRAALRDDGHLLRVGALTCAYTGPALPYDRGPVCLLDGTIYEAAGLALPARSGPELETFIAHAYRDQGDALLGRLRGEFALLLYDPAERDGLLVRDQMGGRGVLWHQSGGRLTFASEYRPLIAALPRRPDPDPAAVAHWLASSGMPGDRSLYAGVHRVEAGCALRLRERAASAFRYWSPAYRSPVEADADELAGELRRVLDRAVRRRLDPGEPGGVLVSGGLDSGSVAAVAACADGEQRPLSSYSATFPRHPTVDESELIEELTSSLGLRSTKAEVHSGSILQGALTYLRRYEVPPVSPNLFFWIPLQRRAAEDGVRALLDGEGGDELFGHSLPLLADRLRRGRVPSALELMRSIPGAEGELSRRAVTFYLRWALKASVPYRIHDATRRLRGPARYAPEWMRPEAAAAYAETDDKHAWKRVSGPRWFANQVQRVVRGMGPALAYDHIRRRAALAGLEPRHPLVDVDVIEFMLRVPPELGFDPDRTRPLLRRSMKGLLPDAIRLRPTKSHFDAIFHESLAGADLPVVRAFLARPHAEVGAYVDLDKVAELVRSPPDSAHEKMWWALHVWRLVTAECWLLGQEDAEAVARLLPGPLAEPEIELRPPAPVRVAG